MKKILKRYDLIFDIIVFGSFVKGRPNPNDIDIACIVKDKDLSLVSTIKKEMNIENLHIELIKADELYASTIFISLMNEGFSVKHDKFLKDIIKISPMRLYSYDLKHLDKSKKTLFGMSLHKTLKKIKGSKVGAGVVLVPISQTGYFEDFLDVWGMKYKTKEWTVF